MLILLSGCGETLDRTDIKNRIKTHGVSADTQGLLQSSRTSDTAALELFMKLEMDTDLLNRALGESVRSGSQEAVGELLSSGINPNVKLTKFENFTYKTPLNMAVSDTRYKIVKLLLDYGARDAPNFVKKSSLMQAIRTGDTRMVNLLLDHGADPTRTINDISPIMIAQNRGYENLVALLIDHGANVYKSNLKNPNYNKLDRLYNSGLRTLVKHEFRRLADSSPDSGVRANALYLLFVHHHNQNNFRKALEITDRFVETFDSHTRRAVMLFNSGLISLKVLSDTPKASKYFTRLRREYPENYWTARIPSF